VRILGVDLGQAVDYTALNVLEIKKSNDFHVNHLERLELGLSYVRQIDIIAERFKLLKELGEARLVLDATGVGKPIVDALVAKGLSLTAVMITGGSRVTADGSFLKVPKRDLVSSVAMRLQNRTLKVAPSLTLAKTLMKELQGFKVTFNEKGHDSYGNDSLSWRESPHDDLVLSVALACWLAEHILKQPKRTSYSWQRFGNMQLPSQLKHKQYRRNPKVPPGW
jgi:hypothetical protein